MLLLISSHTTSKIMIVTKHLYIGKIGKICCKSTKHYCRIIAQKLYKYLYIIILDALMLLNRHKVVIGVAEDQLVAFLDGGIAGLKGSSITSKDTKHIIKLSYNQYFCWVLIPSWFILFFLRFFASSCAFLVEVLLVVVATGLSPFLVGALLVVVAVGLTLGTLALES